MDMQTQELQKQLRDITSKLHVLHQNQQHNQPWGRGYPAPREGQSGYLPGSGGPYAGGDYPNPSPNPPRPYFGYGHGGSFTGPEYYPNPCVSG